MRAIATALGLALMAGCGPNIKPKLMSEAQTHIQKLGQLYIEYALTARDKTGPATADELKKFAKGLPDKRITEMGLTKDEIDGLFVSPRDSQPYVIVAKRKFVDQSANPAANQPVMGPQAVVHEKSGESGSVLVVLATGHVEEADAARLAELVR